MIVYIAGPISTAGVFEENIALFHKAEQYLKCAHTVLNPAVLPTGLLQGQYIDITLAMVRAADCMVMLPNWENSKGASTEHAYAEALGIKISYWEGV